MDTPSGTSPSPDPARRAAAPQAGVPRDGMAAAEHAVGGRYRIESLAGRGGMGRVFRASDARTGAPVAIKLLALPSPHPAHDPEASSPGRMLERLEAEARAMASLDHPALCRIAEVRLDASSPYIAMEWAEGDPLDRYARRQTVRARVTLVLRIIDAVAAMHERGLTHGDLKPANILVGRDGTPTIVDFGLAHAEADSAGPARGGSPGYAPPEQLLGDAPLTPDADVFALGVLLYELLTGSSPFPRNTAPAVLADFLERGAVRLPDELAPDTPADLQKICLAAMEPDPARRYRDAGALAADLRRYLRRETVAARPRLLTDRLTDDIETQIARTREWRRLGMISRRDADNAARVLRALPHAESPWIVDARRLRGSQAALVAGGWILVLAIGVALASGGLHPGVASPLAWGSALAVLGAGWRLHRSGQKRLGLGMLLTAQVAIPAAAWVTLGTTGWLTDLSPDPGLPSWRFTNRYTGAPTLLPVIADTHAVIVSGIAALAATALLLATKRTAFVVALIATLAIHWPIGLLGTRAVHEHGLAGLRDQFHWSMSILILLLVAPSLILTGQGAPAGEPSRAHAPDRETVFRRTAALGGVLLALASGLAMIALVYPGLFVGRPDAPPTPGLSAYAFLIGGVSLGALCVPIGGRDTPHCRRVAAVARWVLPTHLMLPLVFMDVSGAFGVRTPWLVLLLLASLAFIGASAASRWRPFLFAGLAFLAIWFVRAVDALPPSGDAALAIVSLLVGLGLILAAWRAPAFLAKRRLERWTRAADARPDPQARRTWR